MYLPKSRYGSKGIYLSYRLNCLYIMYGTTPICLFIILYIITLLCVKVNTPE